MLGPPLIPTEMTDPRWRGLMTRTSQDVVEAQGLVAVVPPIRSSDYSLCCRSPFSYYMRRRLGITEALSWSKALSRGSWMHERFRHLYRTAEDASSCYYRALDLRVEELTSACAELGIDGDARRSIVEREIRDAETSYAWHDAASRVVISRDHGTFAEFLRRPYWRVLAREARLVSPLPRGWHKVHCVAQPDLLLWHEGQGSVWIVDLKTTSESPRTRAASCPIEFQHLHYCSIASDLLKRGVMQKRFDLPSDARLGGFIHLIVRKPTIEFGMKDRHFTLDDSPLRSGPRKGEPRNERVYHGEPVLENYVRRCRDWYAATGEHEHLAAEWAADPPVNMSICTWSPDDRTRRQYEAARDLVARWAMRTPDPDVFPRPAQLSLHGRLDPLSPFMLLPYEQWGEIVRQERFVVARRDDLPPDADYDVIPDPETVLE